MLKVTATTPGFIWKSKERYYRKENANKIHANNKTNGWKQAEITTWTALIDMLMLPPIKQILLLKHMRFNCIVINRL